MEIHRVFQVEAAHQLPNLPEGHKCRRLHGHSFRIEVAVSGPLDPRMGWVMDFADIDRHVDPLIAQLDHRLLNDIPGLDNPTSELLAVWRGWAPQMDDYVTRAIDPSAAPSYGVPGDE